MVQRSLDVFEADIQEFRNMKNRIQLESPSDTISFVHIDCQPIKQVQNIFYFMRYYQYLGTFANLVDWCACHFALFRGYL